MNSDVSLALDSNVKPMVSCINLHPCSDLGLDSGAVYTTTVFTHKRETFFYAVLLVCSHDNSVLGTENT